MKYLIPILRNIFIGGNQIAAWSTSTVWEEGGSGCSCFMIFASLLVIHCSKPAHSSLPVLAVI